MNRIFVFVIVLSGLCLAQLDFSSPVRCPGQISEWWRDPAGCIGPNNELYAAWTHTGLGSGDGGIYFARSLDTNQTWSQQITIHFWDPTWIHAEYRLAGLAAVNDTVYNIYWLRPEHAFNEWHVYCSRSDDRGATWNIFESSISGSYSGSMNGRSFLALPGGEVLLTFATQPGLLDRPRTYFCRSTNSGVTFSSPLTLPSNPDSTGASRPSIALFGDGRILVACTHTDRSGSRIVLNTSTDNGASWDTTDLRAQLGDGSYPSLYCVDHDRLYLFWQSSNDELKFSKSNDCGEIWTAPFTITSDNFSFGFAASDDRLLALWDDAGSWEAWHRVSGDAGQSWSEAKKVWVSNPFPNDWLTFTPDIRNDMAAFWCHPEPGNNEATWCANAVWQTGVSEPGPLRPNVIPALAASPNPFSVSTRLQALAPTRSQVVAVYNSAGRMVRELDLRQSPVWNGTDASGNRLPGGVYVCQAHGCSPLRLVLSD
jgi:hypothetical protein